MPGVPAESLTRARCPRGLARGTRALFLLVLIPTLILPAGCSIPRWPVRGALQSPFGFRTRGFSLDLHRGVDIDVPDGTEVRAMKDGRVRFAGIMRGYGQVIWLDHPGSIMTVYAHLSAVYVRAGEDVQGGQVIAASGHSGDVTGPHLHFEVWRHGREVDPVPLLGGFPG
jgi:murein DD-endopeptidase MepM/ murein hydrolase activator NlpD